VPPLGAPLDSPQLAHLHDAMSDGAEPTRDRSGEAQQRRLQARDGRRALLLARRAARGDDRDSLLRVASAHSVRRDARRAARGATRRGHPNRCAVLSLGVHEHAPIEIRHDREERPNLAGEWRRDAGGAQEGSTGVCEAGIHRKELGTPQIDEHLVSHRRIIRLRPIPRRSCARPAAGRPNGARREAPHEP
jgi:hypothetical protein